MTARSFTDRNIRSPGYSRSRCQIRPAPRRSDLLLQESSCHRLKYRNSLYHAGGCCATQESAEDQYLASGTNTAGVSGDPLKGKLYFYLTNHHLPGFTYIRRNTSHESGD
ncbi:hypothetical protein GDO81_003965 [Engystomops pustulosus]|uniref:Uncharacterized protein n=1 Tax=Engystomops pustulosus TaxID=76066 RepID=A0AAV7A0W5_ENGPU|nr:hypothetical protein GDO81_003965 [Engystomops pustulosus]